MVVFYLFLCGVCTYLAAEHNDWQWGVIAGLWAVIATFEFFSTRYEGH